MKVFCAFFAIIVSLCSKNVVFAQDRTDFNIQDGYLSKYAGTTPVVEIPDDVVTIGKGVFKKHTEITSVTIPNGVTVIESEAFSGCKNLQNVTLPNGLVSIEEKAFYDCENFTGISIPGSVTNIGESAFSDCKNVSGIDIAYGVQTIGSHAFSDNDNVISVVIPDSVTVLGNYAFSSCNYLQNITFSKSLTKIPSCVVQYCKKIEKLKIPDGIQVLAKGCLNGCSNLTYLSVPDSVTSFDPFSYNYEIPTKLRIYCNTGTAAYDYAVAKDIFYVPLENYESESSGNTGSTTGDTSGSTTGDTSGSTTGNTSGGTTGDTSGSTTGNTSGSTCALERSDCTNGGCASKVPDAPADRAAVASGPAAEYPRPVGVWSSKPICNSSQISLYASPFEMPFIFPYSASIPPLSSQWLQRQTFLTKFTFILPRRSPQNGQST